MMAGEKRMANYAIAALALLFGILLLNRGCASQLETDDLSHPELWWIHDEFPELNTIQIQDNSLLTHTVLPGEVGWALRNLTIELDEDYALAFNMVMESLTTSNPVRVWQTSGLYGATPILNEELVGYAHKPVHVIQLKDAFSYSGEAKASCVIRTDSVTKSVDFTQQVIRGDGDYTVALWRTGNTYSCSINERGLEGQVVTVEVAGGIDFSYLGVDTTMSGRSGIRAPAQRDVSYSDFKLQCENSNLFSSCFDQG